jgi:hypothetical protein
MAGHPVDRESAMDIDFPDDFVLAETRLEKLQAARQAVA